MRSSAASFKVQVSSFMLVTAALVAHAVTFSPHGIQTDSYNYTIVNVLSNNFLALAEVMQGSASPFTLRGGTLVAQSVSNAALADAAVTSAKIADAGIAAVDIGDGQVSSSKLAHAGVWLTVATKPELIAATNAGVARAAWSFVAETASNAMSATQLSAVSNQFFLLSGANHPSYFPALTADVVRFRLSMCAGDEGASYVLAKNNGSLECNYYQYGGSPNNAGVRFMPYAWELYITNAPGGSGLTPVHVGAPTKTSHAVTKAYADAISNAAHAAYVNKAGDTMTGNLTLPAEGALKAGLYSGGMYSGTISIDATDGDDLYHTSVIKLSAQSTVVVDRCLLDMANHRVVGVASPAAASDAATKGYADAISNAAHAAYVNKAGDTMTGMLTTPSNVIVHGLAIGNVPVPTGQGAINAGENYGTMTASGNGARNEGINLGTMTASGQGARNEGYNEGTMNASGQGARNEGYNEGTMNASGQGARNEGKNSGTMTASGQGARNEGYNDGTMTASGAGSQNIGTLQSGQYSTNQGNGSIALLDGSGNMLITNHAAIVLGSGYSAGDRTLVADAVVIRSMGSRTTDAATKGYIDALTNAMVSRAVAVTNTGDSIISRFTFVGGLLQSFTQQDIP